MPEISEITQSILVPALIKDSFVKDGTFEVLPDGNPKRYSGGFTSVYPFVKNGEKWAFRCWHSDLGNVKHRMELVSEALSKHPLPYFCEFTYVNEGIVVGGKIYPTTRMKWVDGLNLKEFICSHRDKLTLKKLADDFLSLCHDMHLHQFAHGDLQHENIIVGNNGQLYLIDYDSMYVPTMNDFDDIIIGKKDYQHPCRKNNHKSSERLDYFSELIIYTSILAISGDLSLIDDYQVEGSEALLFTAKDYEDITSSTIYTRLKSLDGVFPLLLKALMQYLSETDIDNLRPFDELLTKWQTNFSASSTILRKGNGDSSTLTWNVKNAKAVKLSYDNITEIVEPEASKVVSPARDTTYTLTVISLDGRREDKLTVTIEVKPECKINFCADKEFTVSGVPVVLSWNICNAISVELEGYGMVETIGSQIVEPRRNTKYRLKVADVFGETNKEIEVKILPLPIIKSIMVPTPQIINNVSVSINFNMLQATLNLKDPPKIELSAAMIEETPKISIDKFHSLHIPLNRNNWWNKIIVKLDNVFNKLKKIKKHG